MVVFLLLLLLLMGGGVAAQAVPLAQIPRQLPRSVLVPLHVARENIVARIDAQNERIDGFNRDCATVTAGTAAHASCASRFETLQRGSAALDDEKTAFGKRVAAAASQPCVAIEAQLEQDRAAFTTLERTMAVTNAALRDGVTATAEAESAIITESVMAGGFALMGSAAKRLQEREETGRKAYMAIWNETRPVMHAGQPGYHALKVRMEKAFEAFRRAETVATVGAVAEGGKSALEMFNNLATEAQRVYALQQAADWEMLEVFRDPSIAALKRDLVRKDVIAASDLMRSAIDVLSSASELKRFAPHYTLLAYATDYVQHGTKWALGLVQIQNQSFTLGQELHAMRALQSQIERTTTRLKSCKGIG